MMRVKREFLLDKFVKIHEPINLRGIPRNYAAYDEFVQSLYRLGVTPDEFEQWNQEWEEPVHACEKRAKKRARTGACM